MGEGYYWPPYGPPHGGGTGAACAPTAWLVPILIRRALIGLLLPVPRPPTGQVSRPQAVVPERAGAGAAEQAQAPHPAEVAGELPPERA